MRRFALFAVLVLLSVPAAAQDNAAIQKLADQFVEAFNKNAAAGLGEIYVEDAILVPPEADIRMGRKDIQAFWTQQAKQAEELTISVLDTKALGPEVARAVVRAEMTTKGDKPRHLTGRNVVVLQKVGGDWKIATHIWNFGAGSGPASTESRAARVDRDSRSDMDREGLRERHPRRGWDDSRRFSGRERGYYRDRHDWREHRRYDRYRDDYND